MDEKWFWNLIESSKFGGNDIDDQMKIIERELKNFSPQELVTFDRIFWQLLSESYTNPLWEAADIMNGGCSDDGFDYFRGWLIAQGETVFHQAIQNPDSLSEVAKDLDEDYIYECEDLFGIASLARDYYKDKTGQEMPNHIAMGDLKGNSWQAEGLPQLYPKLWAIFNRNI